MKVFIIVFITIFSSVGLFLLIAALHYRKNYSSSGEHDYSSSSNHHLNDSSHHHSSSYSNDCSSSSDSGSCDSGGGSD
ncbi:hypothetical protein [Acinetobacter chenhuanii]|uniref:hypothetical protein n=1 Tax=Acinetobacter sp. XH1801 TaxID=3157355 RepID=UPI0032B54909